MSRDLEKETPPSYHLEISDHDIYEAMKEIPGYLDVTPGDLKEIYAHAYHHALARISCSVKAVDLMTRTVHAVEKETPLEEVAKIMARNKISGVPVLDGNGRVAGIISEKDFCRNLGDQQARSLMGVISECLENRDCLAMDLRAHKAGDIMTSPAVTVGEEAVLGVITEILTEKGINRVPVVDRQGGLVGIVSRADIVRVSFEKPG